MKRPTPLFLSFLISTLLLIPLAQGASLGGVGGKPANPDLDDGRTDQWFLYHLAPGETVEDELLVDNSTDQSVTVKLYPADSVPSTDGGFALEQEVESRDDVGAWVTLSQTGLVLGPRESMVVPFTLTVPNDPTLDVGEHAGGILIQPIMENADQGGIQLQLRTGVRIYVTLPGEVVEDLSFSEFSVDLSKADLLTTRVSIDNKGNTSEDITLVLSTVPAWPWMAKLLKAYPSEVERSLQVLRDSALTSSFETDRPFFAVLDVSAKVSYDQGAETLYTETKRIWVFPAGEALKILVLAALFLFTFILFLIFRRR